MSLTPLPTTDENMTPGVEASAWAASLPSSSHYPRSTPSHTPKKAISPSLSIPRSLFCVFSPNFVFGFFSLDAAGLVSLSVQCTHLIILSMKQCRQFSRSAVRLSIPSKWEKTSELQIANDKMRSARVKSISSRELVGRELRDRLSVLVSARPPPRISLFVASSWEQSRK